MNAAHWTPMQAISYECANEAITDVIAIHVAAIERERAKRIPNTETIEALKKNIQALNEERRHLSVFDGEHCDEVQSNYGAIVRQYRGIKETSPEGALDTLRVLFSDHFHSIMDGNSPRA